MGKVELHRPTSFIKYVELIESMRLKKKTPLWFRGCRKASYQLLPTLYRPARKRQHAELTATEKRLMDRFRARSLPYGTREFDDRPWELLFCMQHHGVPTRLVDWSESPFVGMYFALMPASCNAGRATAMKKGDAAVWILDPIAWNELCIGTHDAGFKGCILDPSDPNADSYKPGEKIDRMHKHPVAIYGCHNSPRIVAQRGVFTVFGMSLKPMQNQLSNDSLQTGVLSKVVIDASRLVEFRSSLLGYGLSESAVFPDMDGLAAELRREESY